MGSNGGGKIPNPFHHHHHHGAANHHHLFYLSPHCPLHRPILQPKNHSPSCYFSTSFPSSIPEPVAPIQPVPDLSLAGTQLGEEFGDALIIQDETEKVEVEEDEEPVYVLTDEWIAFFAKSEAKRKLAKKQAKKGRN